MSSAVILGSTGSIGRQAMDVAENLNIRIKALVCGSSWRTLEEQARKFLPEYVAAADPAAASELKVRLRDLPIRIGQGDEGVMEAARMGADVTLAAMVGIAGLRPTLAAAEKGGRLAIANKESIVCAGEHIKAAAAAAGTEIIPVDSEHSAIFQCLRSGSHGEIRKILLTASGGPFFGRNFRELENVSKSEALAHPNWTMGEKITIDSATLMNKGLEFIEAMRLFDVGADDIEILVHRESVIHSAVEFTDGSVIAQLGQPDMRVPIQYAFTHPARKSAPSDSLDLIKRGRLTFFEPDLDAFRCLKLALEAARRGGGMTTALSSANEAAVGMFLREEIGFNDIWRITDAVLSKIKFIEYPSMEEIFETDRAARALALEEKAALS